MTVTTPKTLPQANGGFYAIHSTLSEEDQALLRRVRAFLEAEVAPVITEYWIREEFPYQLLPKLAELHIMGLPYQGYGCPGKTTVPDGMLMMELARDVADNQVKGFVIENSTPGFKAEKLKNKIVLRMVQNGLITWVATASCSTSRWGVSSPMPKPFTPMKVPAR